MTNIRNKLEISIETLVLYLKKKKIPVLINQFIFFLMLWS